MTQRQEPGLSREAIVSDLRALRLEAGALVLVHSSLSSLGWVESGAQTVIDALLEAVSPDGTVLVPTLTGTIQHGPEHPPIFDPRATPCWTGTIPETCRRHPAARRSRHPTHSVAAVGPATDWLIAGHEYSDTPCAGDSPYGRLADTGGFILLLGVTHDSNTSLHMVEELAGVPYHMQREPAPARVARPDGAWEEIPTRLHLWRWERDFPRVEPLLLEVGVQRTGMVGQARGRLVDARAMRDLLLPLLRRDPLFLLSDAARAAYEQSSA
jgi:aminoglycoside 3-N-acetyltransferase